MTVEYAYKIDSIEALWAISSSDFKWRKLFAIIFKMN